MARAMAERAGVRTPRRSAGRAAASAAAAALLVVGGAVLPAAAQPSVAPRMPAVGIAPARNGPANSGEAGSSSPRSAERPALMSSGTAAHAMVAAANPLAAAAGLKVLRAGGSAADAAVAIQAVLGLVEPQSSGLGGGAFLLYHDARTGRTTAYNGRETAPAGATPGQFLGADGRPLPFFTAVLSGRSTGAPGAVAMLARAQREHGRRPWSSLFGEAERLAEGGFIVTPRLAGMIASRAPQAGTPDSRAYFTRPDGAPYQAGDRLKNPAYARTLRALAAEGPRALLAGPVAADIVAAVAREPLTGKMTTADLAAYRPEAAPALCRPYRAYVICAPPPPAGGVGLLELMGELERTDIATRGPADPQAWVEFAGASRLMYADRDHYVADPDRVAVPTAGLVDPAYDAARAALIPSLGAAAPTFGRPPGSAAQGPDRTAEPGGTSSFVVVDRFGDVACMTTTVENVFGSGRMVDGFFLNNQLTDFSFSPVDPSGAPAANAVAPGKRPRSSMTPALVFDRRGRFVMATGSPGSSAIIVFVAKTLVAVLDWKMSPAEAAALPNIVGRPDLIDVEASTPPAIVSALQATRAAVRPAGGEGSGLHLVVRRPDGRLEGAADPRREGVAIGY